MLGVGPVCHGLPRDQIQFVSPPGEGSQPSPYFALQFCAHRVDSAYDLPSYKARSSTCSSSWLPTVFIEPGSPWQNGQNESSNGVFCDGCLNRWLFASVGEKMHWSRNALETPSVPSNNGRDWNNCKRMLKAEPPHIQCGGSSSHDIVCRRWASMVGEAHRRQGCGTLVGKSYSLAPL